MPTACQKGGQRMSLLRPHVHLQLAHCLHAWMSGTGRHCSQKEENREEIVCGEWSERKKCEQVHFVCADGRSSLGIHSGMVVTCVTYCSCELILKANLEIVFSHIMDGLYAVMDLDGHMDAPASNIFNIHKVSEMFAPPPG